MNCIKTADCYICILIVGGKGLKNSGLNEGLNPGPCTSIAKVRVQLPLVRKVRLSQAFLITA